MTLEEYVQGRLFYRPTGLIYEFTGDDPNAFPTVREISRLYPNPVGYGTGMEDSMLNGGALLDGYVARFERTGTDEPFAHALANGMLTCAENGKDGFLPRSLSRDDGKSHYIDSSIDQYTMFVFGLYRLYFSGMATENEKERIARAFSRIADRAQRNVTRENAWDMLREDGGHTLVTRMRGESIGPHGHCRLPMLYAAAYRVTGDEKYDRLYRAVIDEALASSLPLDRVWHLYALQQMLCALYVIRDAYPGTVPATDRMLLAAIAQSDERTRETLPVIREKARSVLTRVIPYRELPTRPTAAPPLFDGYPNVTHKHEDTDAFFVMQDAANAVLIPLLAGREPSPEAKELFDTALSLIDPDTCVRAHPVHFLAALLRTGR